jgi:hypothetical protein
MIRIRTIIAGAAATLAVAVPVSTAGAAVPTVSPTPAVQSTIGFGTGVRAAPLQADLGAGSNPFQIGAQAAVDGWTAGANAALSGWNMGLQAAANGLQIGANTLTGLQTQPQQVGLP